ncbi:hypothetical protein ACTFIR_011901 [Dictyostelium discoideum]
MDDVLTTDASKSGAGATLKKGNKITKTWPSHGSSTQSNMSPNRWSDTGPISSVRKTLETLLQELDWRAYSRDELQIIVQSNQELQLATEEGNVFIRISPEQSNEKLLNNQNEYTPPQLESMEVMSGLPITLSFAFYP